MSVRPWAVARNTSRPVQARLVGALAAIGFRRFMLGGLAASSP